MNVQDYQLVRADVEVDLDFRRGVSLVHFSKGSHAVVEPVRANGDLWLTLQVKVLLTARAGLRETVCTEHEVVYSRGSDLRCIAKVASLAGAR
jgi:hypothetical protein